MKTLLALAVAATASLTIGATDVRAGDSSHVRVHSTCGHCHQPVFARQRPVRYVNGGATFGWVPDSYRRCCRTPAQVFNYGFGGRVTRHYAYPDVRSYNVYSTYPTSRPFSGFRLPYGR